MATALADPAVARAVETSFLSSLSAEVRDAVVRRGLLVQIPAGTLHVRPDGLVSRGGLVVEGIFRVFVMAADGRRLTVRYARPGALAGLASGIGEPAPVFVEAITDGRLLELTGHDLETVAAQHPTLAWALALEISSRLRESIESLAEASFGTLRARLVRHLFEVAVAGDDGGSLIVPATQQDLADSLGTVREVIARLVGQLRDAGLVEVARGAMVILDEEGLALLAGRWHEGRYWTAGPSRSAARP
jgi:CRP/FNR family transcriptional regulator